LKKGMLIYLRFLLLGTAIGVLAYVRAGAQTLTINGAVEITNVHARSKGVDNAGVVVWLTPLGGEPAGNAPTLPKRKFTLLQKNKTFAPHILVVPAGSAVEFPNKDPFFHNVFSLYDGKRFDLGLYEAGSTRTLNFDHPGISFLFCNIHPEMSAVIIALDTPWYALSDTAGQITIPGVPAGRYMLHVWREGSSPESLKNLSRTVVLSHESLSLGKLEIPNNAPVPLAHKNKYGRDYDAPPALDHGYNNR